MAIEGLEKMFGELLSVIGSAEETAVYVRAIRRGSIQGAKAFAAALESYDAADRKSLEKPAQADAALPPGVDP
jgi:hypothetical protein